MKVKLTWSIMLITLIALISAAYTVYLLWKLITMLKNEENNTKKTPVGKNGTASEKVEGAVVVSGSKNPDAEKPVE